MVDAVSGGRLEFGIGSGNTELDYRVFGVTRENDRQRLSEALEIILKAWSNERSSHRGTFWNYEELTLYPRPVQQPHPCSPIRPGSPNRAACVIMPRHSQAQRRRQMASSDTAFAGSIPALYDQYLGPLLFQPYADELARRAAALNPRRILETAAGTGIVT